MELRIGVSLPPQPGPVGPRQVVQTRVSVLMQDRTHIHKSFWSRDQRCQDVWSNRIHCQNMRQAVFSDNSLWLLVADAGVMNDGIEGSELIDLIGNVSCLGNAGEVPDNRRFCCGKFILSLIRALLASSMQYHAVALFNQKLRGHKT